MQDLPCCYYTTEDPSRLLHEPDVLAVVTFDGSCHPTASPRLYTTGLSLLEGSARCEVWRGTAPVQAGVAQDCHWSTDGQVMFAGTWVAETPVTGYPLQIRAAYQRLLTLLQQRGFPQLYRIWNYLPHINDGAGDLECYKQFCLGRQQAFEACGIEPTAYPAACAIGHHASQTVIYLLAGKQPATHFENPRQMSAWEYPREYGPKSPTFARATLLDQGQSGLVFLSGTASVLGHATQHPGKVAEQLGVTLDNIRHLYDYIASHQAGRVVQPESLKVYLRAAADQPAVAAALGQAGCREAIYVLGDICRADLTLEVDGLARLASSDP